MFESAIFAATGPAKNSVTARDLRPLAWGELVARLAATRDLRALMASPVPGSASFGGRADLAFFVDPPPPSALIAQARQEPVNRDALGGGKSPPAIHSANVEEAARGDQGTQ
ncbi:hypothetical protein [Tsuneonella amylolytica]|uniref:hypothetical protein n=1 Tax=Tsuneonella amylolytica TaxID=2338327 RepID=UPI000EAA0C8D|nr:hypothetical protein [Tsuneonella amylolytica]